MPHPPRLVVYQGRERPLRELAKEKNIPPTTLASRLDAGWDIERAVNTPATAKFSRTRKPAPVRLIPVPPMKYHQASGQARIWHGGCYHYLGKWASAEAAQAYDRALAEIRSVGSLAGGKGLRIGQLLHRFLDHAEATYKKNGRPTSELCSYKSIIWIIRKLFGEMLAAEFGPRQLKAVRHEFLQMRRERDGRPWTRRYVNQQINRVRSIWNWAVEDDLVPLECWQKLRRVRGLRKGKTSAGEQKKIAAVSWATVKATLKGLPRALRPMVELHWLAGCRSSEIVLLRECDIDREADPDGSAWLWHPHGYKTEHMAAPGQELAYWLGPRAVRILTPLMGKAPADKYLFTGPNGDRGKGRLLGRWSSDSYGDAVREACADLGMEPWSPRQIRKGRADEIRLACHRACRDGLGAAAAVLGHTQTATTEKHYTQRLELARAVQLEMG